MTTVGKNSLADIEMIENKFVIDNVIRYKTADKTNLLKISDTLSTCPPKRLSGALFWQHMMKALVEYWRNQTVNHC